MNEDILKSFQLDKEVVRIKDGKCSWCGTRIDYKHGFKDDRSRYENHYSGLCQKCQNEIFGMGDDTETVHLPNIYGE